MEKFEYDWIDTQESLTKACDELKTCKWIAIDLEADNQHLYEETVCLFQCTTNQKNYLIDSLSISDMSEFLAILEDKNIQKIFHDLEFDLRIINKQFKCKPQNLWDTKLAAELCNEPKVSLSALMHKYLDIDADKSHQKANWTLRPISPEMIQYSILDSYYLEVIKSILEPLLIENNRLSWYEEEIRVRENTYFEEPNIPEYLRIKDNDRLKGYKLNLLHHLCLIRDEIARANSISRFQIASNKNLLQICLFYPQKFNQNVLDKILKHKLSDEFIKSYFKIFEKLHEEEPLKRPVSEMKILPFHKTNTQVMRDWRNKLAEDLKIPANLILTNDMINHLVAEHKSIKTVEDLHKVNGIRNWQIQVFGQEILKKILNKLK